MSVKWHYTQNELNDAIRRSGIGEGDTVSLQVSLGRLGLPKEETHYVGISNLVIDTFLDVIGPMGTLVVPTYTYSTELNAVYDVHTTPSKIGEFSDIFRNRTNAIRSRDPILSHAAIGSQATDMVRNISNVCLGNRSVFSNLRSSNAKLCLLGLSPRWSTFLHYIEEVAQVPFRIYKEFAVIIRENGTETIETWRYFAAPFLECCKFDPTILEEKLRNVDFINTKPIGRSCVTTLLSQKYFDYALREFENNPWFTAKGPPCSRDTILQHMNKQ